MLNRILALLAFGWATSAGAFCFPSSSVFVEYVNEGTGHYMLFYEASEEGRYIDNGGDGGRWERTGYVITQRDNGACYYESSPVCRFYAPSYNTHFFTPYAAECDALKQPGSGWVFEGNAFNAPPLGPTGCPAPSVAVRRLYDGVADHRYSADASIIAKMIQRGWVDEGIGFCAYSTGLAPERSYSAFVNEPPKLKADCDAKAGPCVALAQLAPMATRIPPYLPPNYILPNPLYPPVGSVIGVSGQDIYTSRAEGSGDVLEHSFYMNSGGYHIVGSERLSGPYAGMHLTYQVPDRVFPWRNGRERDLVITSSLSVTTLTRANPSSHAYGMPLIQFDDRVSGRSFYLTLQAFGTLAGDDYIGADYSTGRAIVSTSFRDVPLFGQRISGNYTRCDTAVPDCLPRTNFAFQLSRADFQQVLGHARTVDPALSTDPGDYFVQSFRQHNETYLDATLGMATYGLSLAIWPRVQ